MLALTIFADLAENIARADIQHQARVFDPIPQRIPLCPQRSVICGALRGGVGAHLFRGVQASVIIRLDAVEVCSRTPYVCNQVLVGVRLGKWYGVSHG